MNPSTAQAEVLVDELVRNGVADVVLSPGSRNAPLSFAAHAAAEAGRLRLHVRIDERSAGFLALGIAARSRRPVAVMCTSGTAAANLHPAVTEAWQAGVPLLVLTADRPPEMRAASANQTIDQHGLFGTAVRLFHEFSVADRRPGLNAYWRTEVSRACAAAGRGPVHLNVPFREPLVPDGDLDWCESLSGRERGAAWTAVGATEADSELTGVRSPYGLVLVSDDRAAAQAGAWGERLGWPVLSETGGVGIGGDAAITSGMWLLGLDAFVEGHRPEQVVCFGRPTVFRAVHRLLAHQDTEVLMVHGGDRWPAPVHDVREVAGGAGRPTVDVDPAWLAAWQEADRQVVEVVRDELESQAWPTGLSVARDVVAALPAGAQFVLGSSNPARDIAMAAVRRDDVSVHRNRGVAGIDGMVSTSMGAALAHAQPTVALIGDLTFLHDSNGLLLGREEQRPDLTLVVLNDDGGGIFSLLEQGLPEHAGSFERVFGTAHGVDLGSLCAAHGVEHVRATDRETLTTAVRRESGLRVVEVPAERTRLREVHERLHEAVASALTDPPPGRS